MRKERMARPAHGSVQITEGFWKEQLDKIHRITVWDVLNKFEHDHEAGIMKNYEWVAEGKTGEHIGPPWYDGLICEVIRGISDILALSYDRKLDEKIEYYTEKMERAQAVDPDGYINTYTTLMCPDKRWGENGGSLIWQHELYNIGCLAEAGIHYYQATKKTRLLRCAVLAANCLCRTCGPAPRKNIVPAHSLAEEAMVKLYRLFDGDAELKKQFGEEYGLSVRPEDYLELAAFWMDHRGVHHDRASFPHYMGEYAQDHCRIEEQSEAVGHAVRAALMYTGLAAVGIETGQDKYLNAARRLWDNVEQTKLHISGGIGAVHNEERFGYQYDLPNDAYLETCAGVAFAFWAGEMYRAFGKSSYMDALEWTLYNNVLPGLSADGTHYFYENPLISDGTVERWDWHGCPCCPPMFLKLMGSLPDYIYGISGDSLAVNLYIGSSARLQIKDVPVIVEQRDCRIPGEGKTEIVLQPEKELRFPLLLRCPAWGKDVRADVGGHIYEKPNEDGYLEIDRVWKPGDRVSLSMELPAVKVEAHPYVSADIGCVALTRGPLLYCLEQSDNPEGTDPVLAQGPLVCEEHEICGPQPCICGDTVSGGRFLAVPYYLWNNRGKGTMRVWLRQDGKTQAGGTGKDAAEGFAAHHGGGQCTTDLTGWEGRLYRRFEAFSPQI